MQAVQALIRGQSPQGIPRNPKGPNFGPKFWVDISSRKLDRCSLLRPLLNAGVYTHDPLCTRDRRGCSLCGEVKNRAAGQWKTPVVAVFNITITTSVTTTTPTAISIYHIRQELLLTHVSLI